MSAKFQRLKQRCLESGIPYEDPEFPANYRSMFDDDGDLPRVVWKRPLDITDRAQFIVEGALYHDITQGYLGNCWYISSVSILATDKLLFDAVCPPDQVVDESGIFRFNFWVNGEWKEVIIDDRLPTMYGRLYYSSNISEPYEFWCPLLEKAYAKLNGSYQALDGGLIVNGLVDMTGGISERVVLQSNNNSDVLYNADELEDILFKCSEMNTLMGTGIQSSVYWSRSIASARQDLQDQHAYSIIKIVKVPYNDTLITLIHIRDPNGKRKNVSEWKGPWSDGSREWSAVPNDVKRKIGFEAKQDDGEFWMNIEDFMVQFDDIDLLHLTPSAITSELATRRGKREWEVDEYKGSWVKYVSSGGRGKNFLKNPQFKLIRDEDDVGTTVVISLFRYSPGKLKLKDDIYFRFFLLKLNGDEDCDTLDGRQMFTSIEHPLKYTTTREVTYRFNLERGTYFIIPTTYDEGEEADFILRIFSEARPNSSSNIDEVTEVDLPEENTTDMFEILYNRHVEEYRYLDALSLQKIITNAMSREWNIEDINLETSRCLFNYISLEHKDGNLGLEDVRKCWDFLKTCHSAFVNYDLDYSKSIDIIELRDMYKKIGLKVNYKIVSVISKRYGYKGKMQFEDFIQSTSKILSLYKNFLKLKEEYPELDINKFMLAALKS